MPPAGMSASSTGEWRSDPPPPETQSRGPNADWMQDVEGAALDEVYHALEADWHPETLNSMSPAGMVAVYRLRLVKTNKWTQYTWGFKRCSNKVARTVQI